MAVRHLALRRTPRRIGRVRPAPQRCRRARRRAPTAPCTISTCRSSRSPAVRAAPDGSVVVIAATPLDQRRCLPARTRHRHHDRAARAARPRASTRPPSRWPSTSRSRHGTDGRVAHALYHPPVNPRTVRPRGRAAAARRRDPRRPDVGGVASAFSVARQYWTSRGFAVVDVNHGGSTGYGRPFREELNGHWGVLDVGDCIAAARWLAAQGRVDGSRHGDPRRLRGRVHRRSPPSPRPTSRSRPAPTTSASPTSRRSPATPTSSRAATSTGWSAPIPTSSATARRSTTSTASTAR